MALQTNVNTSGVLCIHGLLRSIFITFWAGMMSRIMRTAIVTFLFCCAVLVCMGQDLLLFQKNGILPATRTYPGLMLEKAYHVSLPSFSLFGITNGYTVDQMTDKNKNGERYVSFPASEKAFQRYSRFYGEQEIRTIDLGFRVASFSFLAGHAFRRQAHLGIPQGLLLLASEGNGNYTGKTIQIGPQLDIQAFNDIYAGGQYKAGKISAGFRARVLYGTANLATESADVRLTTQEGHYGLTLQNDVTVRSSGLLRYYSLDSITFTPPVFTFDNFFYNNFGLGLDAGLVYSANDNLTLSISALDMGYIRWDFFPREYESRGTFSFEGLDLAGYIGDTTSIRVDDTLLQAVTITSGLKEYTTRLSSRYMVTASYQSGLWQVLAQWTMRRMSQECANEWAVGTAFRKGIFHLGVQAVVVRTPSGAGANWFGSAGGLLAVEKGPVYMYVITDGLPGLLAPLKFNRASLTAGCSVRF